MSDSPPRSRSIHASQSIHNPGLSASSSRPFLNMLNPMNSGSRYLGYALTEQSVLREESEEELENLESGTRAKKPSHVSWGTGNSGNDTRLMDGPEEESEEDEVPQMFMVEDTQQRKHKGKRKANTGAAHISPTASDGVSIPPRPSEVDEEARSPRIDSPPSNARDDFAYSTRRGLDPTQRALWNWVNVYNLDAFLQEAYYYYEGKGIYSIALARGLNLLTIGFVIGFSTFLLGCVDYSRIKPEKVTRLSDVVVEQCVARFSGFTLLFFILFIAFYVWQIFNFIVGTLRLMDMYGFYTYLLKIPDEDIQTISWPEIVRRIGAIRQENPLTATNPVHPSSHADAKLDAHDVANRIMRQENYLIALFNKELLDLSVPIPPFIQRLIGSRNWAKEGKGQVLTRALEWNLRFCLMEYLFDQQGRVRKVFLKKKNRQILIEGLERRFVFMGLLNAIFAPFIVPYLLIYSFFRYFEEYHKNPSSIGGRRFTQFAKWKFREFNELPHVFTRRLDESHPIATMYIGQFPNEKLAIFMRFVSFIAGSFAAVLAVAAMLDPDLIVHFEITLHRTVIFYLGIFGSIVAVARGMIPEDNRIFEAEVLMEEVIRYTHYMPDEWNGKLHSKQVHQEFGELFTMRILIFVQELLSVILTPFVLWFSLPACAPMIIDFFREFSVHVEGRGYVCSFAEFNFERHGNVKFGAPSNIQDKRMVSNEGKMEKSFLNFKAANPDWNPTDPTGSLYLSRMAELHPHISQSTSPLRRRPGLSSTVLFRNDAQQPREDRAQEYDRALLQSQNLAVRRRQGPSQTMPGSSVFGGVGMAQTAVLGDSNGSVALEVPSSKNGQENAGQGQLPLDVFSDEMVQNGLGESYADGARSSQPHLGDTEADGDAAGLDGEGVLALLTQIYGTKGGARDSNRVL